MRRVCTPAVVAAAAAAAAGWDCPAFLRVTFPAIPMVAAAAAAEATATRMAETTASTRLLWCLTMTQGTPPRAGGGCGPAPRAPALALARSLPATAPSRRRQEVFQWRALERRVLSPWPLPWGGALAGTMAVAAVAGFHEEVGVGVVCPSEISEILRTPDSPLEARGEGVRLLRGGGRI